jgi:hypothetical protein
LNYPLIFTLAYESSLYIEILSYLLSELLTIRTKKLLKIRILLNGSILKLSLFSFFKKSLKLLILAFCIPNKGFNITLHHPFDQALKGSFGCMIFLYYIVLICIIFKITNIERICFLKLCLYGLKNLR